MAMGRTLRVLARVAGRVLSCRSAFGEALLGSVAGLLVGCVLPLCLFCAWLLGVDSPTLCWAAAIGVAALPITTGAVVGSGWKAKPAADGPKGRQHRSLTR